MKDTNGNLKLKLQNLKEIFKTLIDYYTDELNYSFSGFKMPNINLILECTYLSEVELELSHLLQLVLGCAVNCQRKIEFIKSIMEMNEFTQHMLMTAIQAFMCKDMTKAASSLSFGSAAVDDDQLKNTVFELNRVSKLKEDLDRKCMFLEKQVSEQQNDKMSLMSEIEVLKERLSFQRNIFKFTLILL